MPINWQTPPFPVGGTRSVVRLSDGSLIAAHPKPHNGGVAVFCTRSTDQGRHWTDLEPMAFDPDPETDLGDGVLLDAGGGEILYTYRHNHYRGRSEKTPSYAIRVARSRDNGKHWEPHSTVTEHTRPNNEGPSQGLWAPFILKTPDGRLQCYYDDEKTPLEAGFRGHQWFMMRTWDAKKRVWANPTIVSRAHDPKHLSREGMGTVVALSAKRLLCVLESVQVTSPHANVVRYVLSEDGGRTWNWQQQERGVVYEPKDQTFASLAPFLARLSDGQLICLFCTDEDQPQPMRPGSPPPDARWDVKFVTSRDNGKSWSAPEPVTDSHRTYLPGVVEIRPRQVLMVWVDFTRRSALGRFGKL